jgi:hypothetical protein
MHRRPRRRLIPAVLLLTARFRALAASLWLIGAELALHLAGQAWGFTVLAAAVGWLATTGLGMAGSAITKATAVESRVDDLVPVIADAHTTATSANTRVGNLSGRQVSQPNVSGGSAYTSNVVDAPSYNGSGTVYFDGSVTYTGPATAGTAHQHGMGHTHGITHTHGYAHDHDLPTV